MSQVQTSVIAKALPNIERQGGWTFWSLLFTLSVLAFFSYIGMQLVPVYSTNENIEKAMTQSLEGTELKTVRRADIIKKINRQLYIDGSHELLDYKNDLDMKRTRSEFILELNYERTIPVVANLSLVAAFNHKFECRFNGECIKK